MTDQFIESHEPCDRCHRTLVVRLMTKPVLGELLCSECVQGFEPGSFAYARSETP